MTTSPEHYGRSVDAALVSDDMAWVTGAIIDASGGMNL